MRNTGEGAMAMIRLHAQKTISHEHLPNVKKASLFSIDDRQSLLYFYVAWCLAKVTKSEKAQTKSKSPSLL